MTVSFTVNSKADAISNTVGRGKYLRSWTGSGIIAPGSNISLGNQ